MSYIIIAYYLTIKINKGEAQEEDKGVCALTFFFSFLERLKFIAGFGLTQNVPTSKQL